MVPIPRRRDGRLLRNSFSSLSLILLVATHLPPAFITVVSTRTRRGLPWSLTCRLPPVPRITHPAVTCSYSVILPWPKCLMLELLLTPCSTGLVYLIVHNSGTKTLVHVIAWISMDPLTHPGLTRMALHLVFDLLVSYRGSTSVSPESSWRIEWPRISRV